MPTVTMDLNHVSAFVRVVQDGSFTAAAKALGLPKSSVSRSVAQLERDLGVRLLHRTTRKVHLTDAGTEFHDRVARALADIDQATTATADHQREVRGAVRISAPVDLGVAALAPMIARFVRKYPAIHVEVRLSARVVDLAAEGFDLAVRAGPVRDQSLIIRKVGSLELGLYASSRYIKRRGAPATLEDLMSHDCIVFKTDQGPLGWRLTSVTGENQVLEPVGGISADDISFVKKSVLSGAGVGLLPRFLAAREEQSKKLVRVLPGWRFSGSDLQVVYPSAAYVPQRVVVLRDYLIAGLKKISRQCEEVELRKTTSALGERRTTS